MLEVVNGSNDVPFARVLVQLADTTSPEFTPVGLLHSLADAVVRLLGVQAASVFAYESDGYLLKMATAVADAGPEPRMSVFDIVFDHLAVEGPAKECVERRRFVSSIVGPGGTSGLTGAAAAAGITGIHGFPLRLREHSLGSLALLQQGEPGLPQTAIGIAEALSDMVAIALVHYRSATTATALIDQLTVALESRVVIEQAKGITSEREHVGVDQAFDLLRNHARNHNIRLRDLAERVVRDPSAVVLDRRAT